MTESAVVETRAGVLRGRREHGVRVFRGIPYANPPVGALRWRDPRPVEPWGGERSAERFGPSAPQLSSQMGFAGRALAPFRGRQSEDCLYLNVWSGARVGSRRPVLVWLHGGAFVLGSGSTFLYRGDALALRGAVVVTINYRLGALGYLDLSTWDLQDDIRPNCGLRDQIAALRWVRNNIEAFGGDPECVTVCGESAGAMSGGVLLGTAPDLFRRAVLQSGAAQSVSSSSAAADVARRFLSALEMSRPDPQALRNVPIARVLAAQQSALHESLGRSTGLPWQPSIDRQLVRQHPLSAVLAGQAAAVDLIVGTNREEWKLFAGPNLRLRRMGWEEFGGKARRLLQRNGIAECEAGALIELYRGDGTGRRAPYDAWVELRTDEMFAVPAARLAAAHAARDGTTFVYRLDFAAPAMPETFGACHGIDVPLVFGTHRHPLMMPIFGARGGGADALAATLQELWLSFAAAGRPVATGCPPWRPYNGETRHVMRLGKASRLVSEADNERQNFWLAAKPTTAGADPPPRRDD